MDLKKILPKDGPKIIEVKKYVEKYSKDTITVKLGGSILLDEELFDQFLNDISIIYKLGLNISLIHGGGKLIGKKLKENNIDSQFIDGLRVTDENSIKIVEEALNELNINITKKLIEKECPAKSISIKYKTIKVNPISKELGYVGSPKEVDHKIIEEVLKKKEIPVIAPLGIGDDQKTYNINADSAAGAVAKSLKSRRLLLMTDVPGVIKDEKLITELNSKEAINMIQDGTIKEGFIPKIRTCLDALEDVTAVAIIDGRQKHSILFELFSDKGAGTLLRRNERI